MVGLLHKERKGDKMSEKTNMYPPGTRKYLGTFQRGSIFILGNNIPPLRFGDGKTSSKKHVLSFDMNNKSQREQFEAALKSAPYKNGAIVYIESPEEMKRKTKAKKQKETLDNYREMLKTGIFEIKEIDEKKMEPLMAFADQIGAECRYFNKKNNMIQPHLKKIIVLNIKNLLGNTLIEQEKENSSPIND